MHRSVLQLPLPHYYIYDFRRQSKLIFGSGFCIRLRAYAFVNKVFLEADLCPLPLIKIKNPRTGPPRPSMARRANLGPSPPDSPLPTLGIGGRRHRIRRCRRQIGGRRHRIRRRHIQGRRRLFTPSCRAAVATAPLLAASPSP